MLLLCLGCTDNGVCGAGDEKSFLMHTLKPSVFVDERVNGFDLDGMVGAAQDPTSCFRQDAIDHEGAEGIDNALSLLMQELQGTEFEMLPQYILQTIQQGDFLLMIHVTGIDDLQFDSCVQVELVLVGGDVLVGADDLVLDGQTLYRQTSTQNISAKASISEGILYAEGLSAQLLLDVDDFFLELPVRNVSLRGDMQGNGGFSGYMGGVTDVNELQVLTQIGNGGYFQFLRDRINQHADMNPDSDGFCHGISSSFDVEAVEAYLR